MKRVPVKKRKRREQGWLSGHPNQTDYELINRLFFYQEKVALLFLGRALREDFPLIQFPSMNQNSPFLKHAVGVLVQLLA